MHFMCSIIFLPFWNYVSTVWKTFLYKKSEQKLSVLCWYSLKWYYLEMILFEIYFYILVWKLKHLRFKNVLILNWKKLKSLYNQNKLTLPNASWIDANTHKCYYTHQNTKCYIYTTFAITFWIFKGLKPKYSS